MAAPASYAAVREDSAEEDAGIGAEGHADGDFPGALRRGGEGC